MSDILIARLKHELERQGFNYKSLSLAAGLGETTVRDILTGRARNPRRDTLQKIAQKLAKPLTYFLTDSNEGTAVPLIGTVGIGGRISPRTAGVGEIREDTDLEWVEAPPELGYRNLVAVQIRGDALLPFLPDGTLVYYGREAVGNPDDHLNKLCVAQIKNGVAALKILRRSAQYGRYDLADFSGKVTQNAELEWCAKVLFIKPA